MACINLREASGCDITCLGVASGGEFHGWVWSDIVTNLREANGCDISCLGVASAG